ncbi:MAG: methyltransferase domain-containing protein [Gemmatimonadales bacterium]
MSTELPVLGPDFSLAGAPPPDLTPTQVAARESILQGDRPELYEAVSCPCGSDAGDRLLAEIDRHGLPSRNVICLGCGLIRLTPRWREQRYRDFYQSEYRALYNRSRSTKARYAEEIAADPSTGARAAWIEQQVRGRRLPTAPRVVEIGAGAGWNLARLPAAWTRIGYDVDAEFLAIGRGSFGLDMRHGFVAEALAEIAAADLVLLSHVVEHFSHPGRVLETIRRQLLPGALLLIEVPGIFRIHRTNLDVRSYLQNAHTFTYCAATLGDACRRAGLEVLGLDETARAVCRVSGAGTGTSRERHGLPERIIRYLQRCDSGYRRYGRLRRLPGIGRASAALWKRTYLASLGLLVPPAQPPR